MRRSQPLASFDAALRACSACGVCQSVCPTFNLIGLETAGPRGRMLLARALLERQIQPEQACAAFAGCLLCGRCQRACPQDLPLAQIFFAARRMLPLACAWPHLVKALASKSGLRQILQGPAALVQEYFPRLSGRWPALARQPFSRQARAGSGEKVLLFLGCLTEGFFPGLAEACLEIIERAGMVAVLPRGLVCCGRPLAVQGLSLARAASRNLAIFAGLDFDYVASPCPGCLATLRELWPACQELASAERAAAERLITIDLHSLAGPGAQGPGSETIWWHAPCLLQEAEAASIAARLAALGHLAQDDAPACCGAPLLCLKSSVQPRPRRSGRLFVQSETPLRARLGAAIARNAAGADADGIVCACPGCMLALGQASRLPVRHSLEILNATSRAPARLF